jgi:hypothetical protein
MAAHYLDLGFAGMKDVPFQNSAISEKMATPLPEAEIT